MCTGTGFFGAGALRASLTCLSRMKKMTPAAATASAAAAKARPSQRP